MKHEHFRVTYDGEALHDHQMNVRVLGPALLAMGEVLENANRVLNHGKATVSVNVHGSMKTGSLAIDFATQQSLLSHIVDIINTKEVIAAATIMAILGFNLKEHAAKPTYYGLVQVIKWLRNRKIKQITTDEHIAKLYVDDEYIEIELHVLELLKDYQLRKELENVLEPLSHDGIDTFAVGDNDGFAFVIRKDEREWFKAPSPSVEELPEARYKKTLQIERLDFNEENKWRFTDGNAGFFAVITDKAFLKKIANNEIAFSRGDVLQVDIIERQRMDGDKLKTDFEIVLVNEHRKALKQVSLDL